MQLPIDTYILETLSDSGMLLTPSVIAKNIDYNRSEVNTRLTKLTEKSLVERPERGYYEISKAGEAYLAGDLDASDLSD